MARHGLIDRGGVRCAAREHAQTLVLHCQPAGISDEGGDIVTGAERASYELAAGAAGGAEH